MVLGGVGSGVCVIMVYTLLASEYDIVLFQGFFFFQAEDGIRDHAQSRGLGDVYKRQYQRRVHGEQEEEQEEEEEVQADADKEEEKEIGEKQEDNQNLQFQFQEQQQQNQLLAQQKCNQQSVAQSVSNQIDLNQLNSENINQNQNLKNICLLYTSDAADDMQCVDLGGRRIIKKKKKKKTHKQRNNKYKDEIRILNKQEHRLSD
eukprot:TRINITY_DN10096_c0_g1_i2.p1 TRINITY_DN10096_c0_g1~~TRINITY_DN10096_c0_g1_i2.p1  ORF type:complete len:204 (-),score=62.94 TRINITY_DN10096_c0_g1_i2:39-650(-)